MPEISVIVPVFNAENYLVRCIESILIQTFVNYELILVNDGSSDSSGSICERYAKKDKRIIVVHQENKGQAAARNKGVRIAKGNWIHFVDSDDEIHPQMLEVMFSIAQMSQTSLVMCGCLSGEIERNKIDRLSEDEFEVIDIDESSMQSIFAQRDKYELRYDVVWGKLIKKEIVKRIPFTNGRIYEDTAVVCQWFYEAGKVTNSNEKLYYYYSTPNSTVNQTFSLKRLDRIWCWKEQKKFYRRIGFNDLASVMEKLVMYESQRMYTVMKPLKRYWWHTQRIKYNSIWRMFVYKSELRKNERMAALELYCPYVMRSYWLILAAIERIKRDGLYSFIQFILKRVKYH